MATNVYYSVCPFGTGNLLSGGSPTIVVDTNGNATLALGGATFADNIGQGVCVEYNGIVSFIDSITDSTHFHLVTALGVNAPAQTSTAVTSIHHVFESLRDAEAGASGATLLNGSDLTSLDVILNLRSYYDHVDYTPDIYLTIDGYTTSEECYIDMRPARGGTESVYNQQHSGVWDSAKAVLSISDRYADGTLFRINIPYVRVSGYQAENTYDGGSAMYAHLITFAAGATGCVIDGNYLRYPNKNYTAISLHQLNEAEVTITNNIIVGAQYGINTNHLYDKECSLGGIIANNTVINSTNLGFYIRYAPGLSSVMFYNNIAIGSGTDFGINNIPMGYNISSDGTAPGTGSLTNIDPYDLFWDYDNGDFSPKSGSPLIDAGTDLSASMDSLDIIGTERPQGDYWDIGAFEYVVSGGTLSIPVAMHHYNLLRSA